MTRPPLLSLVAVDVDLGGVTVLRGIDWRLERGQRWGVVGENGSGKTTFLGLIAGSAWPAPDRGERRYDFGGGETVDAVRARREIVIVSHELQDRYARWGWNFSALDVVLSGVYRTDVPRRRPEAAERGRALATMRDLGVAHLAERHFLELSRGEQRRVLIARGVAFDPTVLLLDEPASGLDPAARIELDALIARIAPEVTLVCAAHVVADLPAVIDRIVRLEHGAIAAMSERGGARQGVPSRDREARSEKPSAAARASDPLRPPPDAAEPLVETRRAADDRARRDTLPLIEIVRANVWLGARHVLRDVTWRLDRGQHWLVTGPNGSGKSTFLRLLHGQVRPSAGGEIRWPALGDPRNVWTLRRRVAWVSPELQSAYRFPTTVRGCIASGFESSVGLTRAVTPDETRRVDELLAELALEQLAERPLSSLSYGQVRRALIARALANRPRLLLLDEPWEGLDEPMSATLNDSLAAVVAEGTQLVCASHLAAHRQLFTHELALGQGAVAHAGPVS